MLTALSISDVVLIEQLDLTFGPGLTALTGETGAGKSILLDSLGLALGARADSGLVREGSATAVVSAAFIPPDGHPAWAMIADQGLPEEDVILLRRMVGKDGKSRAFINDQPVGAGLLRQLGSLLVEIQGQNEQIGLANPAVQTALLDGFGVAPALLTEVEGNWRGWKAARDALLNAEAALEKAQQEEEWLRFTVEELSKLNPQPDEEQALADERQSLQQAERRAAAINAALAELTPRDRRGGTGPAAALRSAARALHASLDRLTTEPPEGSPVAEALAALDRAEEAVAEAETLLQRMVYDEAPDAKGLEQTEERLFALRAAARKHGVPVTELPDLARTMRDRLEQLETGSAHLELLRRASYDARMRFMECAERLTAARQAAASRLEQAVMEELGPLRLGKARFFVNLTAQPETHWNDKGGETIRFLLAANPGQPPGPLDKVASGGELSRLMLALKVVLVQNASPATLVFDEVDSGVGGATAAAVGERLARVADHAQVLVITHSPQVAAQARAHMLVAKRIEDGRAQTGVIPLESNARREEIARMLAGETITEAARAAADSLLGAE